MSRNDFETEHDWLEWIGDIGDFDERAHEIIRFDLQTKLKGDIKVSF